MSLKGSSCWEVNVRVHRAEKLHWEGIHRFVAASEEIRFESQRPGERYAWVEGVLVEDVQVQQEYAQQGKAARFVAVLHREDDGVGPDAGDAADRSLRGP